MYDRVEWILHFLEQYQQFPCLWKKSSLDFKNRVKREHAEEQLLALLDMTDVKDLRAKIRSIRCTYNQELAKIRKSKESASDLSKVYVPKLAWFSFADSFLKQNLEQNDSSNETLAENSPNRNDTQDKEQIASTENSVQETIEVTPSIKSFTFLKKPTLAKNSPNRKETQDDEQIASTENSVQETIEVTPAIKSFTFQKRPTLAENSPNWEETQVEEQIVSTENSVQETIEVTPAIKSYTFLKRPVSSSRLFKCKRNRIDNSLDRAVDALKQIAAKRSSSSTFNEFTNFGQHVASQLQCLPIEDALILQGDIQKLITTARLASLRGK